MNQLDYVTAIVAFIELDTGEAIRVSTFIHSFIHILTLSKEEKKA